VRSSGRVDSSPDPLGGLCESLKKDDGPLRHFSEKGQCPRVIQDSPARSAVEGGRVLPAPGQEQAWNNRE